MVGRAHRSVRTRARAFVERLARAILQSTEGAACPPVKGAEIRCRGVSQEARETFQVDHRTPSGGRSQAVEKRRPAGPVVALPEGMKTTDPAAATDRHRRRALARLLWGIRQQDREARKLAASLVDELVDLRVALHQQARWRASAPRGEH